MSYFFTRIRAERDRIRAERGVQDLEPERHLCLLIEEISGAARAINDWREREGCISGTLDNMVRVCVVAIDMCEHLTRLEENDMKTMLGTWVTVWRAKLHYEFEKARGEDFCEWDYFPVDRKGFEEIYTFIRRDATKSLTYTINLKQIKLDKTNPFEKAKEVIELVRRELLGKSEVETDNDQN